MNRYQISVTFLFLASSIHSAVSLYGTATNCTIKNRHFPEHLYASKDFDFDENRRQVFSWVPGPRNTHSLWDIERSVTTNELPKYKIRNIETEEYLYAATNDYKHDKDRRRVFTWKEKTECELQCYWDIQVVGRDDDGKNFFSIENIEFREFLYAADGIMQDAERRHVFTWIHDPDQEVENDQQSQWDINCD